MAAGFEKTFEIGRVYRNEGSSPDHLQEFTNMEFYAAYMNLDAGKALVRNLFITIAKEVFGTTSFETRGYKFDFDTVWPEIDYVEEIKKNYRHRRARGLRSYHDEKADRTRGSPTKARTKSASPTRSGNTAASRSPVRLSS
ncbi:MAG: amino acid--tRNA ligase-related protein [bacterium]